MIRLVQIQHPQHGRFVAQVEEPNLRLVDSYRSVYDLALACVAGDKKIADLIGLSAALNYEEVYSGNSPYRLLPCFDHPGSPNNCLVTGTGLTHKASAENRQSMHAATEQLTDSMKMYRIGVEGGAPPPGEVGAPPEWFYKGDGRILRAHQEALDVPAHGKDGGDEAEIAGCYVIGPAGEPYRVGLAQGNEFSDHLVESENYLYLASSKLRHCSLGPELVVGHDFAELRGRVAVERSGKILWESPIASGRKWMSHTIENLEHHHFKHGGHRHPGEAHVHFFGADVFSFRDRVKLEEGDQMVVAFDGMGRPLRNPLHVDGGEQTLVSVRVL